MKFRNRVVTLKIRDGKVGDRKAAVEDLTASAWQFQLHNLSGEVLGFQTKMNQLKNQETRIREVGRKVDDFVALHEKAKRLSDEMVEQSTAMTSEQESATKITGQLQALLKESTDLGQRVSTLATNIEHHDTTAGQQLAAAKQSVAETEAIANKSKDMRTEMHHAMTHATRVVKLISDIHIFPKFGL